MLDATKSDEQRKLLEYELDAVGIRLNKSKPDVVFKRKTTGGVRKEFIWFDSLFTHTRQLLDHVQYYCEAHENRREDDSDDPGWMSVCIR